MPASAAERSKKRRERKRLLGLKKIEVFIANNAEAKAELHKQVTQINKRYNCYKFDIGEGNGH